MYELYTGLRPPADFGGVHLPLIEIRPNKSALAKCQKALQSATHVILTSQTTLQFLQPPHEKTCLVVGKKTASLLPSEIPKQIASPETAEGVAELLENLQKAHVVWPRSSSARPVIEEALKRKKIPHEIYDIYDVVAAVPKNLPPLSCLSKVYFTSPSTVESFLALYGTLPSCPLEAIGPVTERRLDSYRASSENGLKKENT